MDLQALRSKQGQLVVEFDGETLRIDYNPHAWDDRCQEIVNTIGDDKDNTGFCSIFERLFQSWDMKDSGQSVPLSYESYLLLPPFLRSKIVKVMVDDISERGKLRSSDSSSNRRARSGALVPIGTSPSSTSNGQE